MKANRGLVTALPREQYVSQAIYDTELERVFARQWLLLGHVRDAPSPGDFFCATVAGERVIVVRDGSGVLRGHLNVCRHRGHAVCVTESGRATSFTCPYHHWTYGIDGRLQRAPGYANGEQFEFADYGLRPVGIETWNGFVFGWLDPAPGPALADCLDADRARTEPLRLDELREIHRESYDVGCNWKVLLENYLECYHCRGSHNELCRTMDVDATYRHTGEEWTDQYFLAVLNMRPGTMTVSMDGALVSRPLGELAAASPLPERFSCGAGVVPALSRILVQVDHVVTHTLHPLEVGRCRWETRWYVSADAVESVDYDVARVTEVWHRTNVQDIALCESAYAGVRSRWFEPGPLHPYREGAIGPALDTYLRLMGGGIGGPGVGAAAGTATGSP